MIAFLGASTSASEDAMQYTLDHTRVPAPLRSRSRGRARRSPPAMRPRRSRPARSSTPSIARPPRSSPATARSRWRTPSARSRRSPRRAARPAARSRCECAGNRGRAPSRLRACASPSCGDTSSRSAIACTGRGTSPPATATSRRKLDDERVLVTPTGFHKGFITEDDLVIIDLHGKLLRGTKKPSSEFLMHELAYAERPRRGRRGARASADHRRAGARRREPGAVRPVGDLPRARRDPDRALLHADDGRGAARAAAVRAPGERDRHGSPRRASRSGAISTRPTTASRRWSTPPRSRTPRA